MESIGGVSILSDISTNMGLELPAGTDMVKRSVLRQNFEKIDAKALLKTGDEMSGPLILSGDPSVNLGAATKQYVDALLELLDPLGHAKVYYGTALPARHLWVNGCTIGDADSGATGRANADILDLYTVLWNTANGSGSQIQLYTSAGVADAKGASAAADFAAHKRLSLPDMRGRVGVGLDSMGGTSANVVTNSNADILGGTEGEENHALIAKENGPHTHTYTYCAATSMREPGGGVYCWYDTSTQNTGSSGLGTPHNNMQPWIACNYIMRY
jgi:hypothetical protein